MKQAKVIYPTKREHKESIKEHSFYTKRVLKNIDSPDPGYGHHQGIDDQHGIKRDSLKCTCKNISPIQQRREFTYFELPREITPYQQSRSSIEIRVGNVKALQKRRVRRIYIPETEEKGVGSAELFSYVIERRTQHLPDNYYHKIKTSSKCVGGNIQVNIGRTISKKLSPIIQTASGTTSPIEFVNRNIAKGRNFVETTANTTTQVEEKIKTNIELKTIDKTIDNPQIVIGRQQLIINDENIKKSTENIPVSTNTSREKRTNETIKDFSSDSLVQHVHNLENPSQDQPPSCTDPMENQMEREYRKMFTYVETKTDTEKTKEFTKSASTLKRRFEALRKGFAKKEVPKQVTGVGDQKSQTSIPSHKDVSINSDPPSLESRSFESPNAKTFSPYASREIVEEDKCQKQIIIDIKKESEQWSTRPNEDDSDTHGVKGMFDLWGKQFNFDDDTYKRSPTIKRSIHNDVSIKIQPKVKKEGKKFFFFKKKEKKNKEKIKEKQHEGKKRGVTAGRCEVQDGLIIKIPCVDNIPESKEVEKIPEPQLANYQDTNKKAWINKYLSQVTESRNNVHVRWDNKTYGASSSTVFELMDSVYNDTGIVFKSKSDVTVNTTSTSKSYSRKQHVNFLRQNIQAWMIPKTIQVQPEVPLENKSLLEDSKNNNMEVTISDQKWSIDKSKAFSHKIVVVLHSKNFVRLNKVSSEYLRIDIPKGFFIDSSSEDKKLSSDEEVYKVIEYDTGSEIKNSTIIDQNNIKVSVSVKSRNSIEPAINMPLQRDVLTQGSDVVIPKGCDVFGVGIITTQRDVRIRKSIRKMEDQYSDEDFQQILRINNKECQLAKSYLQDYHHHWALLGLHQDTIKSCSNIFGDLDFLSSSFVTSSCIDCKQSNAMEPCSIYVFKVKKSKNDDTDLRFLPKDSLLVFKMRKMYAKSLKSQWKYDAPPLPRKPCKVTPKCVPSCDKCDQRTKSIECPKRIRSGPMVSVRSTRSCEKRVTLPDCETLNEQLIRQLSDNVPNSILDFKVSSKSSCNKTASATSFTQCCCKSKCKQTADFRLQSPSIISGKDGARDICSVCNNYKGDKMCTRPTNNQVSNQSSILSLRYDMDRARISTMTRKLMQNMPPPTSPKTMSHNEFSTLSPSKQKCKNSCQHCGPSHLPNTSFISDKSNEEVSGIKIQKVPYKKLHSTSSPQNCNKDDENLKHGARENLIDYNKAAPRNLLGEGVNFKVQDEDGQTLYERRDYRIGCSEKNMVLGDIYNRSQVQMVAKPLPKEDINLHKEIIEGCVAKEMEINKDDESIHNTIEVQFNMKIRQGDKATEINIDNDDENLNQRTESVTDRSPHVFVMEGSPTCNIESNQDKNDINIYIVIKTFESKSERRRSMDDKEVYYSNDDKILKKCNTVSTGYSNIDLENVYSVQRNTVKVVSSKEHTKKEESESSDEIRSEVLTDYGDEDKSLTESHICNCSTDASKSNVEVRSITNTEGMRNEEHILPSSKLSAQEERSITTTDRSEIKIEEVEVISATCFTKDASTLEDDEYMHIEHFVDKSNADKYNDPCLAKGSDELNTILEIDISNEPKLSTISINKLYTKHKTRNQIKNMIDEVYEYKSKDMQKLQERLKTIKSCASSENNMKTVNNQYEKNEEDTLNDECNYNIEDKSGTKSELSGVEHTSQACYPSAYSDCKSTTNSSTLESETSSEKCMCNSMAARLKLASRLGNINGCCCQPIKKNVEICCNLESNSKYNLNNYNVKDVETQHSHILKSISTNISMHSYDSENVNLKQSNNSELRVSRMFNYNYDNQSKQCNDTLDRDVIPSISNRDAVVYINSRTIKMPTQLKDKKNNEIHHLKDIVHASDVLQCSKTKKAVLKIYSEKYASNDGEHVVAKLPKFMYHRENEINVYFMNYEAKFSNNTVILKIQDEYSDDESEQGVILNKQCKFTQSILRDYYRHWTPLGMDSWCTSDSPLKCCSENTIEKLNQETVKSCHNISNYFLTTGVITSLSSENFRRDFETTAPSTYVGMAESKRGAQSGGKKGDDEPHRSKLPKDSILVFRKRQLYAESLKSQWKYEEPEPKTICHSTPYPVPSTASQSFQKPTLVECPKPCCNISPEPRKRRSGGKHVSLPDCDTMFEELAKQLSETGPEGILTFKGNKESSKRKTCSDKHPTIQTEKNSVIQPVPCRTKCEMMKKPPCSKSNIFCDSPRICSSPPCNKPNPCGTLHKPSPSSLSKSSSCRHTCKSVVSDTRSSTSKCQTSSGRSLSAPPTRSMSPPTRPKTMATSKKSKPCSTPPCNSVTISKEKPPCSTPPCHVERKLMPPCEHPNATSESCTSLLPPCKKPSPCLPSPPAWCNKKYKHSQSNSKQSPLCRPPCCRKPQTLNPPPCCKKPSPCPTSEPSFIEPLSCPPTPTLSCCQKHAPYSTQDKAPLSPTSCKKKGPCKVPPLEKESLPCSPSPPACCKKTTHNLPCSCRKQTRPNEISPLPTFPINESPSCSPSPPPCTKPLPCSCCRSSFIQSSTLPCEKPPPALQKGPSPPACEEPPTCPSKPSKSYKKSSPPPSRKPPRLPPCNIHPSRLHPCPVAHKCLPTLPSQVPCPAAPGNCPALGGTCKSPGKGSSSRKINICPGSPVCTPSPCDVPFCRPPCGPSPCQQSPLILSAATSFGSVQQQPEPPYRYSTVHPCPLEPKRPIKPSSKPCNVSPCNDSESHRSCSPPQNVRSTETSESANSCDQGQYYSYINQESNQSSSQSLYRDDGSECQFSPDDFPPALKNEPQRTTQSERYVIKSSCKKDCPMMPKLSCDTIPSPPKTECKQSCPNRQLSPPRNMKCPPSPPPCTMPPPCSEPKKKLSNSERSSRNKSGISGLKLEILPQKKTCSVECQAWDNETDSIFDVHSQDRIAIRLRQETPSTEEIREGINFKTQDMDERRNYRLTSGCPPQNIYNTSQVHMVSPVSNQRNDKNDRSIANSIEINFRLKVIKGDKTTEINIENDGDKIQCPKQISDEQPHDVYAMNDSPERDIETSGGKNDINIRILIKNFRSKTRRSKSTDEKITDFSKDFSKQITDKFQTVSTGYSDVESEHAYAVERNTVASVTSLENSAHNELNDEIKSENLTDNEVNDIDKLPLSFGQHICNCSPDKSDIITEDVEIRSIAHITKDEDTIDNNEELKAIHDTNATDVNRKLIDKYGYISSEADELNVISEIDTNDESNPEFNEVIHKPKTKHDKKQMLKHVMEQAYKYKNKSKSRLINLRNKLKMILTSDSSEPDNFKLPPNENDKSKAKNNPNKDSYKSVVNYYKPDSNSDAKNLRKMCYPSLQVHNKHNSVSQSSVSSASSYNDDASMNGGCLCSTVVARLKMASRIEDDTGCCCKAKANPTKKSIEIYCNLKSTSEYQFDKSNMLVDVETQYSRYLKSISTNYSIKSYDNIEAVLNTTKYVPDMLFKPLRKNISPSKCYEEQLTLNPETEVKFSGKNKAVIKKVSKDKSTAKKNARKQKHGVDLIHAANLLQCYEMKRAVLKIFTERSFSERGETFVAKLPKFVYGRERASYETITSKPYKAFSKRKIVMMSVNN